jgi:hypothetical protein
VFVRKRKTRRGSVYYSLVENHRVDGKVVQTFLWGLGRHPTPGDLLRAIGKEVRHHRAEAQRWRDDDGSGPGGPEFAAAMAGSCDRAADARERVRQRLMAIVARGRKKRKAKGPRRKAG